LVERPIAIGSERADHLRVGFERARGEVATHLHGFAAVAVHRDVHVRGAHSISWKTRSRIRQAVCILHHAARPPALPRHTAPVSSEAATGGVLAERLLDAAEEEIARTGSVEISLRAVARRAGVSHQAPGFVFEDRAGLLGALAVRGMRYLRDEVAGARDATR